jgi:hypothetical protein
MVVYHSIPNDRIAAVFPISVLTLQATTIVMTAVLNHSAVLYNSILVS